MQKKKKNEIPYKCGDEIGVCTVSNDIPLPLSLQHKHRNPFSAKAFVASATLSERPDIELRWGRSPPSRLYRKSAISTF